MRVLFLVLFVAALRGVAPAQFSAALSSSAWAPRVPRAPAPEGPCTYGYSNGNATGALGITNGGEIVWFQGFQSDCAGTSTGDAITRITVMNGRNCCPGSGAPPGTVGAVYIYDDPNGDHTDPTDLRSPDLVAMADWTTCCSGTNTLEPVPIVGVVSEGMWLVGMMPNAPGEYPAAFDVTGELSMSRTWVTGSWVEWDPLHPDRGFGFFEMGSLGFDSAWVLEGEGTGSSVLPYCTAKTGLACGAPSIGFSGVPAAGATSGFEIRAAPVLGARAGLILYGCAGAAALPFEGGFLCVNPAPLRRSSIVDSGGTSGQCDGVLALDWNTFASGNLGGAPDPCVQAPSQNVNVQWHGRDTFATGALLSDAIQFQM